MTITHNLGFPRIGPHRELKFACEAYWRKEIGSKELQKVAKDIRRANWQRQIDAGTDFIPVGDFSFYDHILDTSQLLGNLPERFKPLELTEIDRYFAAARGYQDRKQSLPACEMTKWFDTNYHYLVPELEETTSFSLNPQKLLQEIAEARGLGSNIKVVVPGPLTYLWLGKAKSGNKLELLPGLIECYRDLLELLVREKISWIQVDEPILALELPQEWQSAFEVCYHRLQNKQINILLASYFGPLKENFRLANALPVQGLHLDITRDQNDLKKVKDSFSPHKVLSLGIINGRNIWLNDLNSSLNILKGFNETFANRLWLAPSCSLLHVPVDLQNEHKLDDEILSWLAFAQQKLEELNTLKAAINNPDDSTRAKLSINAAINQKRKISKKTNNPEVQNSLKAIDNSYSQRFSSFEKRAKTQQEQLKLPDLPTTTIGSFPQTAELRSARRKYKNSELSEKDYLDIIHREIENSIREQEELGLDVIVHGEAERNDMVEYFGEQLEGYVFTTKAWVQSYGSRCVKPPIIYGDIDRPQSMTIDWINYAQSLTPLPVKGMLSGPLTMLQWSFVRDDQPRSQTALQLALALRHEVQELEQVGIKIIQVDEPGLREGLPLRKKDWPEYLDWAVRAFKITTSGVSDSTQIHTHMCYAEFNDIIEAIAALDADVITIESSRSNMKILQAFSDFHYPNSVGPGVYDIHSPNIPAQSEMEGLLRSALHHLPAKRLWVNPDCGLKTRSWDEVRPALRAMVDAAKNLRKERDVIA